MPLDSTSLDRFIEAVLAEDLGPEGANGDITSMAMVSADATLKAAMVAREPMTMAGLDIAAAFFRKLDAGVEIDVRANDGDQAQAGDILMTIRGAARPILAAERSALNILQHLSGVATLTRRYVDAIEGTGAVLLDTRKTTPLLRDLEKYATRMGGAENHRMGLYDAVLIKDNHIALAGGIGNAIASLSGKPDVEVECDTLDQVKEALAAGAQRILLDNMSLEDLKIAVGLANGEVTLEASGGVTLDTIGAIAGTGVGYISVGRITQSAPAVDIGLDFMDD